MSGAVGHISHIFEDKELSFLDIKKILNLAASGNLNYTEKFDGFQVSFSFRDGTAVVARNKKEISTGGIDLQGLQQKEFANDNIKNLYIDVLKSFDLAIKKIDKSTIETLFENGKIFYNSEIISQQANNVIHCNII